MASCENFKASLEHLEFEADLSRETGAPGVHLKCIMTPSDSLYCEKRTSHLGFGPSFFSFVLRKGKWIINKSLRAGIETGSLNVNWVK